MIKPHSNAFNKISILFNHSKISTYSLECKILMVGVMDKA
jgi:hypothetical protein